MPNKTLAMALQIPLSLPDSIASCCVLQGSVLGPIQFIFYSTPLNSVFKGIFSWPLSISHPISHVLSKQFLWLHRSPFPCGYSSLLDEWPQISCAGTL